MSWFGRPSNLRDRRTQKQTVSALDTRRTIKMAVRFVPRPFPARHCPLQLSKLPVRGLHDFPARRLIALENIVNRIRFATAAALLASFFSLQVPAEAMDQHRDKRARQEEKWERERERRDARRDAQEARREARYEAQRNYWDAARYYRYDNNRYRTRRLNRNDYVYRGSDNRYYCRRDDGTTGLIIGGIAGGVLGHILAPGGAKTLGTIIGAGGGALLGRAIDDGDVVCR